MAQILVRDLDPAIVEVLKTRAKQNGRSLEAELRLILQEVAKPNLEKVKETMNKLQKMFAGRKFSDSSKLIREDRKR